MKKILTLILWLAVFTGLQAQEIQRVEYFIDNDPGLGNGKAVSITPGPLLDLNFTVDLSTLTDGLHTLYIRAMDSTNAWGLTFTRPFIVSKSSTSLPSITYAEYFVDSLPSFGTGTPIALTPADTQDLNFTVNLAGMKNGLHTLYLATRDSLGGWSLALTRSFLIGPGDTPPDITYAEYFVDSLPKFGTGTPIALTPADTQNLNFTVNLAGMKNGLHTLYIATRDSLGGWSLANTRSFLIGPGDVPPDITYAEYFVDSVTGPGTGVPIPLAPADTQDLNFTVNLAGTAKGLHILYIMTRDSLDAWSLAHNRPFLVSEAESPADIVTVEYSVDSFSGYGKGLVLAHPYDTLPDLQDTAGLSGVSKGMHTIYWRSISATGGKSLVLVDTVCVRPDALFSADTVCIGNATVFTNNSFNTDSLTLYHWDFGDGSTDSVLNPQHNYAHWGTYTVCLYLSDICKDSFCREVVVDTTPVAAFTAVDSELTVQFTDQSVSAHQWLWEFGDGQTSNQQNPAHTYSTSGQYSVTLTVQNTCGQASVTQILMFIHTGFSDPDRKIHFTLYPNPASQYIMLKWSGISAGTQLSLVDPLGLVYKHFIIPENTGNLMVDISKLPVGWYLFQIQNQNINYVLKWVKN